MQLRTLLPALPAPHTRLLSFDSFLFYFSSLVYRLYTPRFFSVGHTHFSFSLATYRTAYPTGPAHVELLENTHTFAYKVGPFIHCSGTADPIIIIQIQRCAYK